MKHIKKKYLHQVENASDKFDGFVEDIDLKSVKKVPNDTELWMIYETDIAYRAMYHNINGSKLTIPIPDLSLVYYDSAYALNVSRKEVEKTLIDKLKITDTKKVGSEAIHEIYRYYGLASSCLISLFTSLESFINNLIPDDGLYTVENARNSETFSKEQIQKYLAFDKKVKEVLPYFHQNKSFYRNITAHVHMLNNLKNIRDEIVHPKSGNEENLFKQVLNFNYDKALLGVAAFMNFYKKDYCQECGCGVDY